MRSHSRTMPLRPATRQRGPVPIRMPLRPKLGLPWLILLSLAACAAPRKSNLSAPLDNEYAQAPVGYQGGPPPWAGQETSWEKLQAINAWLETQGPQSEAYWRVEGRLQLAEGRMEFYNKEKGSAGDRTNRQRLSAAVADFMRVESDVHATESQMRRAKRGLATSASSKAQPASGLPPNVIPRDRWGARKPIRSNLTRATVPWRYITVHHSALEKSISSVNTQSGATNALRKMQTYHMDSRKWGDLGYHFLIDPQGQIYEGRSMYWQGAHSGHDKQNHNNNVGNIGICLIGNFDLDRPSAAALTSLKQLVLTLRNQYQIPASGIRGHKDWKTTECPGEYLLPFVRQLARG